MGWRKVTSSKSDMKKTLIIGLGNPILGDDGIGIFAVCELQKVLPESSDVDIVELSVGGLALMEAMIGYERVILIDALWSPADEIGQVHIFDAGQLPETLNNRSSHDVDLPTALQVGRKIGAKLPDDKQISIVAITVNQVLDFYEGLTEAVQAALPIAHDIVLQFLRQSINREENMISPEVLRRYALFAEFPPEALKDIAMFSEELSLEAHEYLFKEGDTADSLYLMVSGGVDLQIAIPNSGEHYADVETVVPGEILGWSALVEPYIYHMSAVATTSSRLVVVDGAKLKEHLSQHPEWGCKLVLRIAQIIGDRLSRTRLRLMSIMV